MENSLSEESDLTWTSAEFFLARNDVKFLAGNRIALLDKIAAHGSIAAAARDLGISYKAAWDAVDTMNNLADQPLLVRHAGGKQGGCTQLTEHGFSVIEIFKGAEAAHRQFLHLMNQKLGDGDSIPRVLRRLSMKTSCRNHLIGKVTGIQSARISAEVQLVTSGGSEITAVISHKSLESLNIEVGTEVHALIKSSSVMLADPHPDLMLSARNQLVGKVDRIMPGMVNTEVTVALNEQEHMAATVTNEAVQDLGLQQGSAVLLCFKVSSVILGVMR